MELRARLVVEGFIIGLHQSPYHGFSAQFAEHRPYMPGDSLKHIDWKVYGKTDRFYVKQFEEETNLKAYLLLDISSSMGYASKEISKLTYASYVAAALTYMMLKQQDAVGLASFAEKIERYLPPKSIPTQMKNILVELENVQPKPITRSADTFHELAERIKRRGLIIVLSDLLDEPGEVIKGLKHFRHKKHEVIVFQILDPMEKSFAFSRDSIFEDLETRERLPSQPWFIRTAYQKQLRQFFEQYKKAFREEGIDYYLMDTSFPIDQSLFFYLQKRKRLAG
jgi:uncharacterized protein (DUF58 family)